MATCFLSELEVRAIYLQQAKDLDTHGHYKDAEKLYIKAQEHDLAIDMYRKAHLFNHMIRLIANHRQVLIFLLWFVSLNNRFVCSFNHKGTRRKQKVINLIY